MPDLRQALKDFVATSNSGKYSDEKTLLSKFPELQGYDINVLRDFVATSNSGKYATEDEVFSKFPEFNLGGIEVKKKEGVVLPPSPNPNATELPLGIGSLEFAKPTKPVEKEKQGFLLNVVSSLDKGIYNLPGEAVKGVGTLLEGVTGKGFVSDALNKFGSSYLKAIEELTPQDEEFKGTLADQFGQAFGQVAGMVLTSGASQAAKATTALSAAKGALASQAAPKAVTIGGAVKQLASELSDPAAVSMGLAMGQGEFERAKQAGATDEEAFEAFYKNAAVGSVLEKIPVMQFLKRFEKASAGGISNYIKTKGVAGLTGGLEEMTTEVLQGIYGNLTAQEIYNANQDLFEGIGEAGGVGFGVGFLLNAMGANAKILRKQGREEEAQVVENQIAQFESQAANGGVSSYKIGGVKVQSPEIISKMIDNMDATDLVRANIEIENDPELNDKLQNKIITSSIKEQVRQGNPDLDEASLDAITNLELELRKLEGNTTQTGKDKAASIRSQIKTIQENVQEQTTSEVPVQSGAEDSRKMAEGEPQAGPQVTTEEGVQAEVVQEEVAPAPPEMTERDEDNEIVRLGDKVFQAKKNIARADDTEAAIEEYNAAKKELEDFEASVQQRKDKKRAQSNIESIIEDEKTDSQRVGYEYKELFDQDPRLAALQSSKDLLDFVKSENLEEVSAISGETIEEAKKSQERSISYIEQSIADLEADLQANPVVSSKTQEVAPVVEVAPVQEVAPVTEAVLEVEQYEPITEAQVSHEKKFTRDTAIDYEEDTRFTDSGREVTYLSRVTVEAIDDNTGDAIGGLVKIVDEDKNVSWQAIDVDGNELGKQDFDSMQEAKTALVSNWNKVQKKEFDKEAKRKAKAAEKAAAKQAKKKPVQAPVQEGPTAEDISEIDALLDLDVDDEDNMLRVLNALDKTDNAISKRLRGGANDALLALPLSTVQLVVKTLKALVKGGMMLRDAIRKVSSDNNISQQLVKDILNISEIQDGFNELMDKVGAMIDRQTRRGTPEARMISNIDTLVRNSEVYQNATDSQKKILEREARAKAGAPARRAPSIGRILGVLKDITNVSREDKLKIISQIRQLSKDAAKDLANEIRDLAKTGKITVNQAANIVARFGKVNMLSEISVSKFVDYMTKVFNDAEYNSKLSSAKSTKRDIAKLSKNKDKDANLRDLGQEFIKIDPSMVKDIDEYNEMASKIKEAIKGSTIRGQKVSFASTVNVQDATAYIKDTLDAQDKMMRAEKAAEIQSLMGIDVSEFSYDDMMMLLESDKPITKYNEGIIRDTINRAFGIYSSIIKDAMRTGKDPFTGEDVKFTESQKDVVDRFMKMDLNVLKPKEALQAVDALANFLQNQSTARMESVVSRYTGLANAKEISSKGIKAFPLKKYWSRTIGRILGEQTTNLNVLFERMFKGFNKGGMVMDKMGLTKLINKKAAAEKEANNIVDRFVNLFYDKKANGEDFNSAYNNIERGMASFMMRNVIGTEQEMKAEFDRRKNLILKIDSDGKRTGSIAELEKGNEKERAKAELYQKAYDNILKDSNNIDDIKKNTDKVNLEGVNFWMNEWSNKYDQLSDVAENVYNKKLDKDINYTPDRYFKLSSDTGTVEITEDDSAFLVNSGVNNLYQRETGVLMTATRPDSLPVNPESGDVNRYIDLSFDNNNANSMYDALVDINTAAPIRQIQAFLNSSDYKKIVPTSEDAKILKDRIQLYVRNIRDKNPYSNDELSSVVRKLNKIAAIGVGQALGGVTQPLKQVIPVMLNTLVNTKGSLNLSATFNKAKNDFINKSGYAIANRGIESQAQVESLNRLMEEVSKSKGDKLIKKIEELNKWWLDKFLVKPDVFIARASWLSYYEKYLKDNGLYGTTVETKTPSGEIEVTTPGIDYNTHKLNEDAANYAQRMVDRQQNVSDTDLAGKLFADRGSANQLLVKTLMPFASFRMNQSARLGADLATLTNKTSSKEDKAVAKLSLAGFGVEAAAFRLMSIGISILLGSLAKEIMGVDEDDEEYEKRVDNIIKGGKTGVFTDVFSPIPLADKLVQAGGALITQSIEDATGLPTAIYSPRKEEFLQNAGLFGIAADRAAQLYEITKLSVTGEYTDDFGKEKTISEDAQDGLKMLIVPALMTNTGLAPSEVNTIVRYGIKDSKKARKSPEEQEEKAERAEAREESKQQKIDALESAKQRTSDPKVIDAIDEKLYELEATAEEKKEIEEANKIKRSEKESLLYDSEEGIQYDTETELKRYNKKLWESRFGKNSDWYNENESEKEAEKLLNQEIRKMEDKEYGYTPPAKKKRARNADGTYKRRSGG